MTIDESGLRALSQMVELYLGLGRQKTEVLIIGGAATSKEDWSVGDCLVNDETKCSSKALKMIANQGSLIASLSRQFVMLDNR